eukprot:1133220-Rhodomonas_salina.2
MDWLDTRGVWYGDSRTRIPWSYLGTRVPGYLDVLVLRLPVLWFPGRLAYPGTWASYASSAASARLKKDWYTDAIEKMPFRKTVGVPLVGTYQGPMI